jgi:hypothetical protein
MPSVHHLRYRRPLHEWEQKHVDVLELAAHAERLSDKHRGEPMQDFFLSRRNDLVGFLIDIDLVQTGD